jgi:hypothetical protein
MRVMRREHHQQQEPSPRHLTDHQVRQTDIRRNGTASKMLKRQMYGRANFDLLRKRVLYTR